MLLAKNKSNEIKLIPSMLNRHGLIAGSSGSGKTVTLKKLAELFSDAGIPVLVGDIKGDLTGFLTPIELKSGLKKRCENIGTAYPDPRSYPVRLWDVYNKKGKQISTTIVDFGSTLLANVLQLNATQSGVITFVFRVARDQDLALNTIDDLRQVLIYCLEHRDNIGLYYGNITRSSISTIQRGLLTLEDQGGNYLFKDQDPFNFKTLIRKDKLNQGVINLLDCVELIKSPQLYGCFLIYLLSQFYDNLPEAGDLVKPEFIFFFDEAHLIFSNASKLLLSELENIMRLIRSKGVGVYFCSQSPNDLPDIILGQLGHRIQHSMRAYTAAAQRDLKVAANTMRKNPYINAEKDIPLLNIGEALISVLDKSGSPTITEKTYILPPNSKMGLADPDDYHYALDRALSHKTVSIHNDKSIAIESSQKTYGQENNNTDTGIDRLENIGSDGFGEFTGDFSDFSVKPIGKYRGIALNALGGLTGGLKRIIGVAVRILFILLVIAMCIHIFPPLLFLIPVVCGKIFE